MPFDWQGVVPLRAGSFFENVRIKRIEGRQAAMLNRLSAFAREHTDYSRAQGFLGPEQRRTVRKVCTELMAYDRIITGFERYLAGRTRQPESMRSRIRNIMETNEKLRVMLTRVKEDEFALMDKIIDGELREEAEIEERLVSVGPKAAEGELNSLKKEMALDRKALAIFGRDGALLSERLSERAKNIPALQQEYKVMVGYMDKIHRYYSEELKLKNKVNELEGMAGALDAMEHGIYSNAGDMTTATPSKKTTVLGALRELQARRLAYASEVADVNSKINQMNRTFSEFRRWFAELEPKPDELVKEYREAEKLYYGLYKKTVERGDRGISSVAQLIQRFESIPPVGT